MAAPLFRANREAPPPVTYNTNLRRIIGIGQGDAAGNTAAYDANHTTGKVWQREGDLTNLEYGRMYDQLRVFREHNPNPSLVRIVDDIEHLPVGMRLNADVRGISIGELVEEVRRRYGEMFLRGLYLYATVRDIHLISSTEANGEGEVGAMKFNSFIRDTRVKHVPLWRVLPVLPVSVDLSTGEKSFFTGGSLDQHVEGMKKLFHENLIALMNGSRLDTELSGSDVASFFVIDQVSIVRRNQPPAYMDNRISPIRTGGFGELLPTTTTFTLNVGELVECYGEHIMKSYPKMHGVTLEGKKKAFRKDLTTMIFTTEVLEEEVGVVLLNQASNSSMLEQHPSSSLLEMILDKQHFTVVIPGGTGCCVDNCIEEVLKLALHSYRGLPFRNASVEIAKQTAKNVYVAERLKTMKNKRSRGASPSNGQLEMKFKKDFDEHTKNGYSPFFFRLLKDALKHLYRINPRIFYERYEETHQDGASLAESIRMNSGELKGVRRRLKEVLIHSATPKKFDIDPLSYLDAEGCLNISMFRINLNGEVHRHYPKAYYSYQTSKKEEGGSSSLYLDDEEESSSGLLHAVGVFPYLPFTLLKDKAVLHAFVEMIQKKTTALMRLNRGKSFGSTCVTNEDLKTLVDYQRKRHLENVTQTLIYGDDRQATAIAAVSSPSFNEAVRNESERREFVDKPLIVAYDIETVELTSEAITSGAVLDKFLKYNPNAAKYEQLERQIPYMVQWVPVNLSDESSLLQKKEALTLFPRKEEARAGWGDRNDWIRGKENGTTTKKYRKGWIVLDEVKIEYGGDKLGQCVEDFIENVFSWAVQHSYTSVKCYAHNGACFDTLIIQAFNTKFAVAKILKVKGSVLNLRLKIPLSGERVGQNFAINFGDTKKFLSGGLGRLCKDFLLPDEWSKLDFPITRINWRNCYHPEIKAVVEPYGKNDAYALAFIIKQINRMLCLHPFEVVVLGDEEFVNHEANGLILSRIGAPTNLLLPEANFNNHLQSLNIINIKTMKPPIDQFCTIMSFVKKVLYSHVKCSPDRVRYRPSAVDVPALRHWVDMSLAGGRVSAYCKAYASSRFVDILQLWMKGDLEGVRVVAQQAIRMKDTMVVLDMTSLYPSAMTYCPLPMGKIFSLTLSECESHINSIGCPTCEAIMTLCSDHKLPSSNLRPFSVILVRKMAPSPTAKESLINLVGRKVRPKCYKSNRGNPTINNDSSKKNEGICYSVENEEEATWRLWGDAPPDIEGMKTEWNVFGEIQSYTNIDLYWARKSGFVFEVVGGFSWEMSGLMGELYEGLFRLRAKAKSEKNHSLQLALKNVLNGGYGVHCQKVINSAEKVVDMPPEFYDCDIRDTRVTQFLRDHHHRTFDSRFVLKENIPLTTKQSFIKAKMPADLGEVVGGSSPNHVGSSVVAWSRHLMNLVMFPLMSQKEGSVTYTDTDSMAVTQEMYDFLLATKPWLIDEGGKTMSTFKNDHSDIFRNGRVVFSALGGKKVKMHIVVCPDTGELKICNTFKGFMNQGTDEEGKRFDTDKAGYTISSSLLDILYDGKPRDHVGERWTRSLSDGGVRIERNVDFEPTSEAYLGHCAGYVDLPPPNPFFSSSTSSETIDCRAGVLVGCIPHGSTRVFHPIINTFGVHRNEEGELVMGEEWRSYLDYRLDSGGMRRVTRKTLDDFLLKYFAFKDGYYGEFVERAASPSQDKEAHSKKEVERKEQFEKEFQEWGKINNIITKVNESLPPPEVGGGSSSEVGEESSSHMEEEEEEEDGEEHHLFLEGNVSPIQFGDEDELLSFLPNATSFEIDTALIDDDDFEFEF